MAKAALPKATVTEKDEAIVTVERTTGRMYHALGYEKGDEMERKARLVSATNALTGPPS